MTDFAKRIEQIPSEILLKIAKIEELKGKWIGGANLSPQTLGRLKQSVLITSTGASTRIEGARLSDEEIEDFIRGINIKDFKSRDEEEVRGYFELLRNVFENWESFTLNENLVKSLHNQLLKYVEKDQHHKGSYKSVSNEVDMKDGDGNVIEVLFESTPPYLTPIEMGDLVGWTSDSLQNGKYHPLLVIGNFAVQFLKIHPFEDGNGRLSRILVNYLLLSKGYTYVPYVSQEKLIEENKAEYYIALRKSQKTFGSNAEEITAWLNFFLDILLLQSQLAVDLLDKEKVDVFLSKTQLEIWNYIQGTAYVSRRELVQNLNIPIPTVQQVLGKLLKLKRIEKVGEGAGTRYRKKT